LVWTQFPSRRFLIHVWLSIIFFQVFIHAWCSKLTSVLPLSPFSLLLWATLLVPFHKWPNENDRPFVCIRLNSTKVINISHKWPCMFQLNYLEMFESHIIFYKVSTLCKKQEGVRALLEVLVRLIYSGIPQLKGFWGIHKCHCTCNLSQNAAYSNIQDCLRCETKSSLASALDQFLAFKDVIHHFGTKLLQVQRTLRRMGRSQTTSLSAFSSWLRQTEALSDD